VTVTCRAVYAEISAIRQENLILFVDGDRTRSLWYWAKREDGKIHPREHLFIRGQPADPLMSKLVGIVFDIGDFDRGGNVSVVEVARRLKNALDVERVTKRFYRDFQDRHIHFLGLIDGVGNETDRRWYASVLLNRLMFIHFLQKKGFLHVERRPNPARDVNCLGEKLAASQKAGPDRYYAEFLKPLFFIGFAKPDADPEKRAAAPLIGDVPYLNGVLNEIRHDRFSTDLKIKFEQATWDEKAGTEGKPVKRSLEIADIERLRPFHWGFAFDDVFQRGGFDAVITNPPWQIFTPQARELFAERSSPVTKNKMNQLKTRKRFIVVRASMALPRII
jgi:hypothetical protein